MIVPGFQTLQCIGQHLARVLQSNAWITLFFFALNSQAVIEIEGPLLDCSRIDNTFSEFAVFMKIGHIYIYVKERVVNKKMKRFTPHKPG